MEDQQESIYINNLVNETGICHPDPYINTLCNSHDISNSIKKYTFFVIPTIRYTLHEFQVVKRSDIHYHLLSVYNSPNHTPDLVNKTTLRSNPIFVRKHFVGMEVAFKPKKQEDNIYYKGLITKIDMNNKLTINYSSYKNDKIKKSTKTFDAKQKNNLFDNLIWLWSEDQQNLCEFEINCQLSDMFVEHDLTYEECYWNNLPNNTFDDTYLINLNDRNDLINYDTGRNAALINHINRFITNNQDESESESESESENENNEIKKKPTPTTTSADIMSIIDEMKEKFSDADYLKIGNYLLECSKKGL